MDLFLFTMLTDKMSSVIVMELCLRLLIIFERAFSSFYSYVTIVLTYSLSYETERCFIGSILLLNY